METNNLMVSVGMLAYNHEKYIGKAIESIISQKCEFDFELVIAEDCSEDDTLNIVLDYQKRFPNVIRVISHEHNLGMVGNEIELAKALKGKYIAWCEGDDFWCDEHKLSKQIAYLEANNDIFATMHNVYVVDDKGVKTGNNTCFPYKRGFLYNKINATNFELAGQINSLVNRNFFREWTYEKIKQFYSYNCNGDQLLQVFCGMNGGIYFFETYMSCYRLIRDKGSSYSAQTNGKNRLSYFYNSTKDLNQMLVDFFGVYQDITQRLLAIIRSAFLLYIKHPTLENKTTFNILYNNGDFTHFYILKSIITWVLTYPTRVINRYTNR